jgi:hypothetical protein
MRAHKPSWRRHDCHCVTRQPKSVGRSDVDIANAELKKISVPHGTSLPALLRSFGRHPCLRYDLLPTSPGRTGRRVAEREGFEPPIGLHLCRISSAVHSTTLPPLQAPFRGDSSRPRGRGEF